MTTDDAGGVLLRLEGGARAVAAISQMSAGRRNRLHVQVDGTDGSLAWDGERPEELWIGHRGRPNELLWRDPALLAPAAAATTAMPAGHAEGYADTFRELYRVVYAAVAAGGPPSDPAYPTFRDGHVSMLLGEAVARSHAERRWVRPAPAP
jgi:predicted dehydrogenase